jgi:putative heme transporter
VAIIGLALALIGVPLVIPLATLVFLGAFIPMVGAWLSGAVAALVALIHGGVGDALLVVAAIVVIQQLKGNLLYPVIVGRAVSLHALAILLVLAVGSLVAGLAGALLSVPLAAAVWTAIKPYTGNRDDAPA